MCRQRDAGGPPGALPLGSYSKNSNPAVLNSLAYLGSPASPLRSIGRSVNTRINLPGLTKYPLSTQSIAVFHSPSSPAAMTIRSESGRLLP